MDYILTQKTQILSRMVNQTLFFTRVQLNTFCPLRGSENTGQTVVRLPSLFDYIFKVGQTQTKPQANQSHLQTGHGSYYTPKHFRVSHSILKKTRLESFMKQNLM